MTLVFVEVEKNTRNVMESENKIEKEKLHQLVKEVLEKGYLMSLGTLDDGGVWVCDVNISYDDSFNIYWMSSPQVRHSKAIEQNSRVAGTITVSNSTTDQNLGIQFSGTAEKISDVEEAVAMRYFAKKDKEYVKGTTKSPEGRSWYVIRPSVIELIHQQLFGYSKQKVVLE